MNKIKVFFTELSKIIVLELPLLLMSWVLFIFSFTCAFDPFDKTQVYICEIIVPLAIAVVYASPLIAVYLYWIHRKLYKTNWMSIVRTSVILTIISSVLWLLYILIFY